MDQLDVALDNLARKIGGDQREMDRLRAENSHLRAVLRQVEWELDDTENPYCPWCEEPMTSGHAANCPRQLALGE
jgi:hypothetical protein